MHNGYQHFPLDDFADRMQRLHQRVQERTANIRHLMGQGALLACFAAPCITSVDAYGLPRSHREWINAAVTDRPAASALQGVLLHFDLRDLYHHLQPRLVIHSFWNSLMKPEDTTNQGVTK